MLAFHEGLVLYHGSYADVREIDLERCAPGKDFGRGFYLTTDYDQAKSFVALSARKHRAESGESVKGGYVSAFRLMRPEELLFHAFRKADERWLHFVAANRRSDLFMPLLEDLSGCDVIAGKIANDQTARTLQLYVSEAFGKPGTEQADRLAVSALLPNRLSDQYCFRTEKAIGHLVFEGSDVCEG
ncbi:DUF3990 domain-containing protein [Eggerthellaceae bacterium zg-887]|uniref:DUF3990 domain-containing protein n=1 Tax=Xiamenia xianingshaonis TaxID=2682776 RepID=UPI00140CA989|nr:DUF3990 domain-containing protein [Xiamenia xianingshaonis]NHM16544.1 DUF3990 domain-containing protein [Xiamenia xianingshaonis]